ncbi:MAG TPA: response regulator, partial [Gemmatimonadales bacterium]
MRVLIAEDDAVGRLTLQAMLTAAGFEVTAATDGQEALDAWRLTAARVVISDWMMPAMDGLALCRHIRDARSSLYTYFILLTGRGGKESFLTAMESGIDDF